MGKSGAKRLRFFGLHEASLFQRNEPIGTQDQVIEDLDAEGLSGVDELPSVEKIPTGRFG